MRRGTARHERSNLSKKSSDLLPEAEEAARMDQRIAGASLGGGRIERFTELAAEFARLKVDLIVAATQREYTTPHACRQKKAPTEWGFSSYLEADPS